MSGFWIDTPLARLVLAELRFVCSAACLVFVHFHLIKLSLYLVKAVSHVLESQSYQAASQKRPPSLKMIVSADQAPQAKEHSLAYNAHP